MQVRRDLEEQITLLIVLILFNSADHLATFYLFLSQLADHGGKNKGQDQWHQQDERQYHNQEQDTQPSLPSTPE